jgi:hypothetical protein
VSARRLGVSAWNATCRLADSPRILRGPYTAEQCGEHVITNTATFETTDTHTTGSDDHTVTITVPCNTGCTLTQGYWKTHSVHGPAKPADSTWDLIGGPDQAFFISGQTWYQVFWTAPKKGNAYYILAHEYEAAVLNIASGADSTNQVTAAITAATTWFQTHTPASNLSKGERNQVISWAGILGSYNEGKTGPGHCSEDPVARSAPD